MNKIDWDQYERGVEKLVKEGVDQFAAQGFVLSVLFKSTESETEPEVYSPFETVNS